MEKNNNLQKVFRGANVKNQQKLVRPGTVVSPGKSWFWKLTTSHCTDNEITERRHGCGKRYMDAGNVVTVCEELQAGYAADSASRFGIMHGSCERTGHTRESVQSPLVVLKGKKCEKEATFFMASQVMRITLKAYDHHLVDASAKKIIETVKKNGSQVSGPVPLPTKKEVVTILRAVHKYKDSREQFEQRTHKRLIDIITPTPKTVDALQRLEMPAGVYIDIKMKNK